MCGIAGAMNWGDAKGIEEMTHTQVHRGPDDSGLWEEHLANGAWVGLGSCRLAIRDLSPAGHMPMRTADGTLTLVYNGEVYNYTELRGELEGKGYRFSSHSDTEVVLYLYKEYGPESVKRLNGMFGMALWDGPRQQLFLARDHFGIKPLYYCHQGRRFAFASEVKSLFALPEMPRRLDYQALGQYLSFLWVPDPRTMFESIWKVPAGHYGIFREGTLQLTQYWDLKFPGAEARFPRDEAGLAVELRERFERCVRSQMVSDVPLGAFLSAGLDSSAIVAAMARAPKSQEPIRTFTIAFAKEYCKGELAMDDPTVAARTARHFGCEHTEIIVGPNVVELLPKLVWNMDEPMADPAIIMAYLVNHEAHKKVTVLLSGVGGDELFAGYRKYQGQELANIYCRIPAWMRKTLLEPAVAKLPSFRDSFLKGHVRLAKKMGRSGSLPPRDRFIMDSIYLNEAQKDRLCTADTRARMGGADPRARHLAYFENVAGADFLNQMLYVDTKAFMTSLNLTYNDKMSMASSVEVRVPFLDWQLAEWCAWNIPPELKLHGQTTKHIFREAMRPILPPEVLRQKKAGFSAPVDYWLETDLRPMVDDLLSEKTIASRGLFEPAEVRRFIEEQRRGREDWSLQIWQFLTLELWMRTFMDQ